MKISVDTNILVRVVLNDDQQQAESANTLLRNASAIIVSLPCLCEFVWVLRRGVKLSDEKIVSVLQKLLDIRKVEVNRPAVEQGMELLKKGGDFADAILEYESRMSGAEMFYSFDKQAIRLLQEQGKNVQLLQ